MRHRPDERVKIFIDFVETVYLLRISTCFFIFKPVLHYLQPCPVPAVGYTSNCHCQGQVEAPYIVLFFFQLLEIMQKYRNNMNTDYKEGNLFAFVCISVHSFFFRFRVTALLQLLSDKRSIAST